MLVHLLFACYGVALTTASVIIKPTSSNKTASHECGPENCILPDCKCCNTDIPGKISTEVTPQIVLLTFDGALSSHLYGSYFSKILSGRTNPNGCPISATFFVSHDYTDYSKVNELHRKGHEIGVHSITHVADQEYWNAASYETLKREFAWQRKQINHLAHIPEEDIVGARFPFLQLPGSHYYQLLRDNEFLYDCSWPTQKFINPPLWPYTLDYPSKQDCLIGKCPNGTIEGAWVFPIVVWKGADNMSCATVDSCKMPKDADGILELFKENFLRHYKSNKAPFGVFLRGGWFEKSSVHLQAYSKFLDYLETLDDVYIVSIAKALNWIRSPKSLMRGEIEAFACEELKHSTCPKPKACSYTRKTQMSTTVPGGSRYMTQCNSKCPQYYPWLDNPLGKAMKE